MKAPLSIPRRQRTGITPGPGTRRALRRSSRPSALLACGAFGQLVVRLGCPNAPQGCQTHHKPRSAQPRSPNSDLAPIGDENSCALHVDLQGSSRSCHRNGFQRHIPIAQREPTLFDAGIPKSANGRMPDVCSMALHGESGWSGSHGGRLPDRRFRTLPVGQATQGACPRRKGKRTQPSALFVVWSNSPASRRGRFGLRLGRWNPPSW